MDARRVIDESRPMLEEFLSDIGLHRPESPLDLRRLLDPFSRWVDAQEVTEDDRVYLAARLAAFICEYLVEVCSGRYVIVEGRVFIRVAIQEGVMREFDPFAVALDMATNRSSLKGFLEILCS